MMSGRKLPLFFSEALLFLLAWSSLPVDGAISRDFSECNTFFYNGIAPRGFEDPPDTTVSRFQPICQKYKRDSNIYRFATLYDRPHRVPVYSAYIANPGTTQKKRAGVWYYEPQLNDQNGPAEMVINDKPIVDEALKQSQAFDEDYLKGSVYTRGHLNPNGHHDNDDDREATFTLTNIVPQFGGSNEGPWKYYEERLEVLKKDCKGTLYVITGAMPYCNKVKLMNEKVSVPEYMWSASCCSPSEPTASSSSASGVQRSFAVLGRNDPMSDETFVSKVVTMENVQKKKKKKKQGNTEPKTSDYNVREIELNDLEALLNQRFGKNNIKLFDGDCK